MGRPRGRNRRVEIVSTTADLHGQQLPRIFLQFVPTSERPPSARSAAQRAFS
jgi:hypothetical protein